MVERSVFKARRVANPTVSGWLPDHAVLTEGEWIQAVVPQRELPGDVGATHRVHELGHVSLVPGLVDVHAHMHCSATSDAYHQVAPPTSCQSRATRPRTSRRSAAPWM